MRIVGGALRGRIFNPPKSFKARPTTDFAKEALFNILQTRFDFSQLRVLDLFAGTGSIGFEFGSRGAKLVHAVEQNYIYCKAMAETARMFQIDAYNVFNANALTYLARTSCTYNLIFADPPYSMNGLEKIPELVLKSRALDQTGMFVFEHSEKFIFSETPYFVEQRNYRGVNFTFFKKNF